MSADSIQPTLSYLEIGLLLAGAFLLLRLACKSGERVRWLGTNQLPHWPVSLPEFVIFLVLIFLCGLLFQVGAQLWLGGILARSPDQAGWEIAAYGSGFHGGALLGWLLFRSTHASWQPDPGTAPPPLPAPALPWPRVFLYAGGWLLASLPVIYLISFGWGILLRQLGLPDEPQDLVAIFANARSPWVVAGMLVVACGLVPLNEELIFRAGLYRFCRQNLGRAAALLISGCLFGAMHRNWAGFLPLATLGAVLAVAYEATGSIRVPIVAHGLFNLMSVLFIVFAGGPGQP